MACICSGGYRRSTSPRRRWRCSLRWATWRSWRLRSRPAGSRISSAIERASSQDPRSRSSACFCVGWARVCPVCSPRACWWRSGTHFGRAPIRRSSTAPVSRSIVKPTSNESKGKRTRGRRLRCSSRYSRAVSSSSAGVLPQDGSSKRFCAPSAWASRARWSSHRVRATRDRSRSTGRRTAATPGQHCTQGPLASGSWR